MRRIAIIAVLVACAVGAARAQSYHACLEYNAIYYDLVSTPAGTTLDRYNGAIFVKRETYAAFHLPAPGTVTWDEGVAFAATMQTRNSWLNNEPTSAATWVHSANSDSWMWYTTVNGVPNQFEFTTAKCRPSPPPPNCPAAGGSSGVTCTASEDCCGAGGMFPRCIPKSSGDKCCTHFNGATACAASQSCCGAYGPGASSSAFCCNAGSSCCHASSSTQGATCCPGGKTCCAGSTVGLCCGFDEICEPSMNRCAQRPIGNAPTPVPANVGLNRGCISYNGWFYDLRSDASVTTLDRYQGSTFVNRQQYAAFHRPAPGTTQWDEGVAFAAAMQTRGSWLNGEQTSGATWFEDSGTGNDRFTFLTTVNGAPTQFVFVTEACPPLA